MSQNLFASVAKAFQGGAAPLNLDAEGNLRVANTGSAVRTVAVAHSSSVANQAAVAILPDAGTPNGTFVSGFQVSGLGATAAGSAPISLTGCVGGTLNYVVGVPGDVNTSIVPLVVLFVPPLRVTPNGNAVLDVNAFGAGNTNVCVNIVGYTVQP